MRKSRIATESSSANLVNLNPLAGLPYQETAFVYSDLGQRLTELLRILQPLCPYSYISAHTCGVRRTPIHGGSD